MHVRYRNTRRYFLRSATVLGTGLALTSCGGKSAVNEKPGSGTAGEGEMEVTAVEDLMREHGVLRRALFVYTETAAKLRLNPSGVPLEELEKTATLFHAFGEDYHEKKLEEAYIFPALRKAGGPAASYVDVLIAQHQRGREITEYILSMTKAASPATEAAQQLAQYLDSFVRMYRPHAAREDTVVFPAWKQTLTAAQLDEMGDKFEDIEQEQFGEDGFEKAVRQIAEIETSLGLADLGQFTAPGGQSPVSP